MDKPKIPFVEFPKIARYSREIIVSEKIDGTNAQVYVNETMTEVFAGSRNKWITPSEDNFGFARWVDEHKDELLKLGPGSHFGEWWGAGVGRRYNQTQKHFSLFNTHRWSDAATRPTCCNVVPVLWQGPMDQMNLAGILQKLRDTGSVAAPGFMRPEGVVVFHTVGQWMLKKTIEGDDTPKSQQ